MELRETIIHGSERLPVALYDVSPRHIRYEMQAHWHPEHELLYIREGSFELRANQKIYRLQAGDVAFCRGGSIHAGTPQDCVYTCILLNLPEMIKKSDICMEFAEQVQTGEIEVFPLLSEASPAFAALCEKMRDTLSERQDGYAFEIKSHIFSLFGMILNRHLYTRTNTPPTPMLTPNGRIKTVIRYIEENYASPIKLADLSDLVHMTPSHLCRSFKAATGKSPLAFTISHRLSKAHYSLLTTDSPVTDIALSCGFGDVSYFTRLFRAAYGETPRECRKRKNEVV